MGVSPVERCLNAARTIVAFAIATALCGTVVPATATVLPFDTYEMRGTYAGILRCTDCAGIRTEVVLKDPGVNAGQGSGDFTMRQRLIGGTHAGKSILTRGRWFFINHISAGGYQKSGDIELLPEDANGTAEAPRLFKCVLGQKLEALDRAKRAIPGFASTLYRRDVI